MFVQCESVRHTGYIIANHPFNRVLVFCNPLLDTRRKLWRSAHIFLKKVRQKTRCLVLHPQYLMMCIKSSVKEMVELLFPFLHFSGKSSHFRPKFDYIRRALKIISRQAFLSPLRRGRE